ncbi:universal stress protein [Halorubellus sp. PRR65]|uniref:universal stress protein n=1 Tax=Halorubellus sp. PRR65 TaxID=3098148 RepID=UPI002B25D633|nr:universal stress protein [Halorubellus sp. PRR65]
MSVHVLVAYDDSTQADRALEFALEAFPDATVTLLTVIDPADAGSRRRLSLPPLGDQWLDRAREDASDTLDDTAARVRDADVDVDTTIEVGRPANTIVGYAEEHDVDHVVMGSHGRSGVTRILLGSVAETVIRRSSVPVTVARDHHTHGEDVAENGSASGASEDSTNEVSEEGSA